MPGKPKKIELQCDYCKETYFGQKRKIYKNRFCSQVCKNLFYSKKIDIVCNQCGKVTAHTKSSVDRNKTGRFYCAPECYWNHRKCDDSVYKNCEKCGESTKRKSGICQLCDTVSLCCTSCKMEFQSSLKNKLFCSESCRKEYYKKHYDYSRNNKDLCECGGFKTRGYNRCKNCVSKTFISDDTPIGELIYKNHHKSSAFALIRSRARAYIKRVVENRCCAICQYDRHVEVCHIKGIAEFDLETPICEVNHIDNLLLLCPTHHWEFDNGILVIDHWGNES